MARFGLSITMAVAFRGVQQEFSNVFHYQRVGTQPSAATVQGLKDEIIATLRSLHCTDVSFLHYRAWSADGSAAQNQMIAQGNLSGTGNQAPSSNMDRERAFLVSWRAGSDSRGHPVYLRKWFHSGGAANGYQPSTGVLQQTLEIPAASRTLVEAKAEELREVGGAELYNLCSKNGRNGEGGASCHRYLEHHQLGDMWR
jgi:hypothetical protein